MTKGPGWMRFHWSDTGYYSGFLILAVWLWAASSRLILHITFLKTLPHLLHYHKPSAQCLGYELRPSQKRMILNVICADTEHYSTPRKWLFSGFQYVLRAFCLQEKKTNPVSKCQSHCVFGWYKWYFLSWHRLTLLESTQRTKKVTLIAVALVSKHSKWYYILAINYTFFTLNSFIFVL